jgi:ADP-ribose pyrophosphatase YjhB (NUDIX family)
MRILPAAIGIVFNSDKTQVLLIKRKDIPIWVLPGGGVESNETAEDAVVREIEEETGVIVEIERKCAEYTPLNRLAAFTSVFICYIKSGKLSSHSSETAAIQFYPLNQLPSFFFPPHKEWIEDSLTHSELVKKTLTGINYKEFLKCFLRHPWYVLRYLWTRFFSNQEGPA